MDLHKVTFPTFVLEPRSMLERITDFMSHPDLIFGYAPSRCAPCCAAPLTHHALQRRELRRPRGALHTRAAVLPRRLAHQAQGCQETVRVAPALRLRTRDRGDVQLTPRALQI